MRVRFADKKLEALYDTGEGAEKYPSRVVKKFNQVIDVIKLLENEQKFYQFNGWRTEKLSGNRKGQYSIRMNKQYLLVYEIEKREEKQNAKVQAEKVNLKPVEIVTIIVVLELGDYH
jgi:toxin HigB-1